MTYHRDRGTVRVEVEGAYEEAFSSVGALSCAALGVRRVAGVLSVLRILVVREDLVDQEVPEVLEVLSYLHGK